MWVLTTSGNLINIDDARQILMTESFEFTPKDAMEIVAHFPQGERITLAVVIGTDINQVRTDTHALFHSLVHKLRNNESFCDLMATGAEGS